MNTILIIELFVGLFLSLIILSFFVWGVKNGQFDDSKKMMNGLLFDDEDDLNDAVKKQNKINKYKQDTKVTCLKTRKN